MHFPMCTDTLLCIGTSRPYMPEQFQHKVFDSLHSLPHPKIRATKQLVTERFFWPKMNSNIQQWACSCL